jgi:hypothetical protein
MLELTPQDHALLRHLNREEERCLQAYLRTGTKHPNVQQNLWRARKELKKFLRNLHIQGKPM